MNFSVNTYSWVCLNPLDYESVSSWVFFFPNSNPLISVKPFEAGSIQREVGAWGGKVEDESLAG